ncbi:MAG: acyl carrier protein [Chitinivibrionales bacterium]|nr:acyl carrier protein [Chitinivibrionales bacterium]
MDMTTAVRQFIVDTFLYGDDTLLTEETSFLRERIVDSTGLLELVSYLEDQFGIQVADHELTPENLDSLRNIRTFLERKVTPPLAGESPAV